MRVFVIGSGAREHALVWKLAQSPRVSHIYAAPGNPGIAALAECVPFGISQLRALADFAEHKAIDLTIVGPEVPLVEGIADIFRSHDLPIFGPGAAGAALEGSKAFAKELMTGAGIPTAQHRTFTQADEAMAYLEQHGAPVVVKADGNAAGKGAIVALDMATAQHAIREMMVDRVFGSAGDVVVIEDYVTGDEIGSTAICNGTNYLPLTLTQDHKRALDHDQGLNTGGMGVYTPVPFIDTDQEQQIRNQIITPTLQALQARGIAFSGVLYSNIMLTERGPVVLEHNTRFGDPETQALMVLMQADILDVLDFANDAHKRLDTDEASTIPQTPANGGLANEQLDGVVLWKPGYALSLTLASGGYPNKYITGLPITGIEDANRLKGVQVFHAGTALRDGKLVTAGGRVLSVVGYGETLQQAQERAYEAASRISFEGMHYRHDIGHRGLTL